MLRYVLTFIQVFSSLVIIALVLLQRGRGADAGAGFGAGASGTVFGARGASTGLSRATAIAALVFMVNSLVLAYTGTRDAATPKPLVETPAPVTAPAPLPAPSTAPTSPATNNAPSNAPTIVPTTPAPSTAPQN
jgi:preprotein translocase subunit SecG